MEVRSEGDYGPAEEREMAAKRHDYFAAGTLVVWDVDVLRQEIVRVIEATVPAGATTGTTGTVQVVTPGGTLSSNAPFRVAP